MISKYYVLYDVPKTNSISVKDGPHTSDDVQYRADRLSNFDGVENVRIISEQRMQEIADEGEAIVDKVGFTSIGETSWVSIRCANE